MDQLSGVDVPFALLVLGCGIHARIPMSRTKRHVRV